MIPPSPRALPLLGHLNQFRRDPLGLIVRSVRDHGDLVKFRLGPHKVYLINHPDALEQVLRKKASNYDKDTRSTKFIRDICGEALLTTNGGEWKRRRQHFQPAFHRAAIAGFSAVMKEEAAALVARWSSHSQVEASTAFMATTFRIVARALFGAPPRDEIVTSLEGPVTLVLTQTFSRLGSLTGRKSRAFRRAMIQINETVDEIISARTVPPERPDLLELIRTGTSSVEDVRNEAISFLLAGHETTANALTWLFAYLAHHPEEQARCAADSGALDRALQETLRLAPPIWIIERHAIEADEIAGCPIPRHASVVACPYTVHRHPDFWENPEAFQPDRFLSSPPKAYLPFGLGPRVCIGKEFALMEAHLIASALLEKFQFTPVNTTFPDPDPAITLRVKGGLPLRVQSRTQTNS